MEFGALGPVTVCRDGDEIDLGSPGQRAVLALLLVHHGHVLSADRMLDELWGDRSDGKLKTLKHFKEDVSTLDSGNECGISFVDWEEMEDGMIVECYVE